ncbi:MAG: hypothetical protein H7144_13925, partial [Burkholderiales bacterium]|nr:hypothetical protein [Phycisphaerae bacterium]
MRLFNGHVKKSVVATAELLETRRLYAVTLYLLGGTGADNIVVTKSGTNLKVTINANPTQTIPSASISRISVSLQGGNDKFTSDNSVTQPMNIDGNFGKDTITTGGGADSIFGGNENDRISGGEGNDTIDGGSGDDTLNGNGGNDSLFDGSGSDKVFGGTGIDQLDAGL